MAVLLFSCVKEEYVETGRRIELTAQMEVDADSLPGTKTHLEWGYAYYPVVWDWEDEIAVYDEVSSDPQKFTLSSGAWSETGTFEGTAKGNNFIGFYPYQMAGKMSDGSIPIELPMTQNYVAGSFGKGSFPMIATGDKEFLKFRNLCALMQLSLKGTGSVLSITVTSNDKEMKLSGRATAKFDSDGIPQLTMLEGGSDTVVLDCGVVDLKQDNATDFYIVIPAQTYKGGLEISVNGYMDTVRHNIPVDVVFERSEMRGKELAITLQGGSYLEQILVMERAALIEFYNSTNGDNWTKNTNWCSDKPLGEWHGVSTDGQGRVIGLNLMSNSMSGPVPASIGNLKQLEDISFSYGNNLSGEIFEYICDLRNLRRIHLMNNQFSGSIPESIGNLKNLYGINIHSNNFTGTIPESLWDLTNLEWITMTHNNLSGHISKRVSNLKKLTSLNLDFNSLTGPIPDNIGECKSLECLMLSANNLTGYIPESICELTNLKQLCLYKNGFYGKIPENIGNLNQLTDLWIYDTYISGSIPESMSKLTNLEGRIGFYLYRNQLSGEIPQAVQDSELWKYQWFRFVYGNGFKFEDLGELYGPDETVECLDGKVLDLGEVYKNNKYTILHTWELCPQDVHLVLYPQLQQIHEKYSDKGVKIVGWTQTEYLTRETIFDYIRQNEMDWDIFLYGQGENEFRYCYEMHLIVVDSIGKVVYASNFDKQINQPNRLINLLENDFKMDKPEGLYESTDYSVDGKVKVLQKASKGAGIDVVLMGDGYSDRLIADGTYDRTMQTAYDKLFEKEPYNTYRDYFNVYSVYAVSKNEVYIDGSSTALECSLTENSTDVSGDNIQAMNYASKAIGLERMQDATIVVAINKRVYAGTCYMYYPSNENRDWAEGTSIAYVPIGEDDENFGYVLHHEAAGHGFAKLADEYAYELYGSIDDHSKEHLVNESALYGWWKNVDLTGDPAQVKWKKFLQDSRYANEGLGVFEGAHTYWKGVWKPTQTSIMVHNTGEFNAPSREAIYYRIHKLAYGPDWEYDYEKFVEYDSINRNKPQTKAPLVLDPQKNFRPTAPPVVVNMDLRELMNQNN